MAPRGRVADPEREAAARCASGFRLTPRHTVPSRLRSGDIHAYRIARKRDEVLDAVVEQRGADVAVALRAPSGRELMEINSPNGSRGPEPIFAIAAAQGDYCLEVRAGNNHGDYTVRVDAPRSASAIDRVHAEAVAAFSRGERIRKEPRLGRALPEYEKAFTLWSSIKDRLQQGMTLYREGWVKQNLGHDDEAIGLFLQALPLLQGHAVETASVLNRLGAANAALGRSTEAVVIYRKSFEISRNSGDLPTQAGALVGLGQIYQGWGEYRAAYTAYEQALYLRQQMGRAPTAQARLLNDLADLDLEMGRPEDAYDRGHQALRIEDVLRDKAGSAASLRIMGAAKSRLGEHPRALQLLERSLAQANLAENDALRISSLANLGAAHLDLNELDQASNLYKEVQNLSLRRGDPIELADATANLAGIAYERGDWRAALSGFDQARRGFERIGKRAAVAATLYGFALAHRAADQLPEARADLDKALAIVEDLRLKPASSVSRASFFATRHDYYELYIDILMQMARRKGDSALEHLAFELSERARARALLDELGGATLGIQAGVDPGRLARLTQLERKVTALEGQLPGVVTEARDAIAHRTASQSEIRSILEEQDALRAEIRENDPRYAALTQPHPLHLREIQAQVLDERTALLTYSLGGKRSYLWLVRKNSCISRELAPGQEIEMAARDLYQLSSQPRDLRALHAAAAKLSHLVLDPIEGELGQDRLLVVAEGALQYVSFAMLPLRATAPRLERALLREHEIVVLPSASIPAVLRRELLGRPAPAKELAVLADPVFQTDDERVPLAFRRSPASSASSSDLSDALRSARDLGLSGFQRLPNSREEARSIYNLVPRGMGYLALGFDASRELALNPVLAEYKIVHFATHAVLDSRRPELSGIVLSLIDARGQLQNGFLRAHDIYNLHLPVDLVVLSACQTALGRDVKGEGLISLTRGFMYAGASRVVVSLWNVSDKGTAEFMRRFYSNMIVGKLKPAAALRATQASMMDDRSWSSPYYWAGFVLQGEWR